MKRKNSQGSSAHKKRNDIIFIFSSIFLTLIIGGIILLFQGEGDTVTVTVDGNVYNTYSLEDCVSVDIYTGDDLEDLNRLVISDGKAKIEFASCPDVICACHSPIFRSGESIVCLPHRVMVTVNSSKEKDDIIS